MTRDDISKLTIGEVEAIVERATAALSAFREMQAQMGAPVAMPVRPGPVLVSSPPLPQNANLLTAEERARKAALMAQFDADGNLLEEAAS